LRGSVKAGPPGDFGQGLGQIPYIWPAPPNPAADPLLFDFDRLNASTPMVSFSASVDLAKFRDRGGKVIWNHGVSDPGPSALCLWPRQTATSVLQAAISPRPSTMRALRRPAGEGQKTPVVRLSGNVIGVRSFIGRLNGVLIENIMSASQ
jgi:hypothetical protein